MLKQIKNIILIKLLNLSLIHLKNILLSLIHCINQSFSPISILLNHENQSRILRSWGNTERMPLVNAYLWDVHKYVLTWFESVIFRFLDIEHNEFLIWCDWNILKNKLSATHVFDSDSKVKQEYKHEEGNCD